MTEISLKLARLLEKPRFTGAVTVEEISFEPDEGFIEHDPIFIPDFEDDEE